MQNIYDLHSMQRVRSKVENQCNDNRNSVTIARTGAPARRTPPQATTRLISRDVCLSTALPARHPSRKEISAPHRSRGGAPSKSLCGTSRSEQEAGASVAPGRRSVQGRGRGGTDLVRRPLALDRRAGTRSNRGRPKGARAKTRPSGLRVRTPPTCHCVCVHPPPLNRITAPEAHPHR